MQALVYHGSEDVRVETIDDPTIIEPTDAIIKVSSTAICGSDLHLYNGLIATVEEGDVFGHEFMGEVVEVGSEVKEVKKGDRIAVPFVIACGSCWFCQHEMHSLCDTTNAGNEIAEELFGYPTAGFFGYTKLTGKYQGGQAQFVRVPFVDSTHLKIPAGLADETVLFLTDIFPTGYMAADNANIQEGDTVAIWGAGPVAQFAIRSAKMHGAGRVVVIDRFPKRLAMAEAGGADTINYEENEDVFGILKDMTNGRGPDSVIDAVGMEAHGAGGLTGLGNLYDKAKQAILPGQDRITALRQAIYSVRKGGTLSIVGVYGGMADKFPTGIMMNKAITIRQGQTPVQKYMNLLLEKVVNQEIDPSFVVTHTLPLAEAPKGYKMFRDKEDDCVKVVLKPW